MKKRALLLNLRGGDSFFFGQNCTNLDVFKLIWSNLAFFPGQIAFSDYKPLRNLRIFSRPSISDPT